MLKLTRLALCLLLCFGLTFALACKKDEVEETPATTEYETTTEMMTTEPMTMSTDMGTDLTTSEPAGTESTPP